MRPTFALCAVLGVLSMGCPVTGGGDDGGGGGGGGGSGALDHPHSQGGSSWTVLVYMTADNDLEPFALQDLQEMMQAGSSSGYTLVVQVDRADGYASDPIGGLPDFTTTKRVLVQQGALQELQDLGEQNMADPATLADFVSWGLRSYPADRTALFMWDHGGGWMGFGVDESAGGALLSLPQIEQGIAQGRANAGNAKPFTMLGFDACLMATWEVALTLAPHGEYLVASEETEPGHGWDWTALQALAQDPATPPETLGHAIVDGFRAQAMQQGTVDSVTLSLIDLYRLGSLGTAMDGLAKAFDGTPAAATAFGRGEERAQRYGDSPDPGRAQNLCDVGSLVAETAKDSGGVAGVQAAITQGLSNAVLYHVEGAAKARSQGLSVYFPPDSRYYDAKYDDLAAASAWRAFLKSYFGGSASAVAPAFTDANHAAPTSFDGSGHLVVQGTLAAEGVSAVARASMLEGLVSNNALLVLNEEPAALNGATVQGTWDLSILSLTQGGNTGYGFASLEQLSSTKFALDILFAYRRTAGGAPQDCIRQLVFTADAAGNVAISSDAYYVSTNGAFGELSPEAGSTLTPLIKTVDLSTGQEGYADGASQAFTTSVVGGKQAFDLSLKYVTVASGKQVFGLLTAQNAAGQGDAVIGVAVTP